MDRRSVNTCVHNSCELCPFPKPNRRTVRDICTAAHVVAVVQDHVVRKDLPREAIGSLAAQYAEDYHVEQHIGIIAGAVALGISGLCGSFLDAEITHIGSSKGERDNG